MSAYHRDKLRATKVLIDSLIALKGDGGIIIGRGVPNEWVTQLLTQEKAIKVLNFPILNGDRIGFSLTGIPPNQIRLELEESQFAAVIRSSTCRP